MRDEEYEFYSDCREKKSIANSAFKRRTHTGKGGRVRLPSDNLSKKELEKMNGEEKSYRLNEPMSWKEFMAMPDDIKVMYIKLLRQKFGISGRKIAEMMGIDQSRLSRELCRLGIGEGKHSRGNRAGDIEAWYAWCGGVPKPTKDDGEELEAEVSKIIEQIAEEVPEEVPVEETPKDIPVCECSKTRKKAVPTTGKMTFEGLAEDVLETVRVLLGGGKRAYQYYMGCPL